MAERPEDLNLPLSVVSRLVKEALPSGVNLSKEARVALARSASVFVLYLTSSANMLASKDKRSTIRGQDVMKALDETDFSHFEEPLQKALDCMSLTTLCILTKLFKYTFSIPENSQGQEGGIRAKKAAEKK
jgi:DNA polymerase epsilon subunit 3